MSGNSLDSQGLGVADVGKVGDKLEAVDNGATGSGIALDTETENTTETALQVLLRVLVVGVALQARIGDPADVGAVLEPLSQGKGILGMALSAQAQGLGTEEELLSSERVESGTQITKDLDTGTDDECDRAEGVPELEAVIAVGGVVHLGEPGGVLAPVELARVDDDTANSGAVAANPLGGGVNDDVSTVINGSDEVATSAKGVVDLICQVVSLDSH